jgi:hypothetical protein
MKRQPTRTPLTSVRETGTYRGRRILVATYPSATTDAVWETTLADDGHPLGCTCPAGRNHHRCWHQEDATNAVVTFYRALYAPRNDEALANEAEHLARYLGYPQDQDERDAAELQAIAVRLLRQERAGQKESAA